MDRAESSNEDKNSDLLLKFSEFPLSFTEGFLLSHCLYLLTINDSEAKKYIMKHMSEVKSEQGKDQGSRQSFCQALYNHRIDSAKLLLENGVIEKDYNLIHNCFNHLCVNNLQGRNTQVLKTAEFMLSEDMLIAYPNLYVEAMQSFSTILKVTSYPSDRISDLQKRFDFRYDLLTVFMFAIKAERQRRAKRECYNKQMLERHSPVLDLANTFREQAAGQGVSVYYAEYYKKCLSLFLRYFPLSLHQFLKAPAIALQQKELSEKEMGCLWRLRHVREIGTKLYQGSALTGVIDIPSFRDVTVNRMNTWEKLAVLSMVNVRIATQAKEYVARFKLVFMCV